LIYKSDVFEVLSICWDIGQVSRVHNHRDQNCWMVAPIGRLKVQNFKVLERDPASGKCNIEESDAYTMDEATPGVVRPEQPVHQVLNLAEFGERATSIHIYSRPYSTAKFICRDEERIPMCRCIIPASTESFRLKKN
jgi:cysteine dioxygenase